MSGEIIWNSKCRAPQLAVTRLPPQGELHESVAFVLKREKLALIALGANTPHQNLSISATLHAALARLAEEGFEIVRVSQFFQTPCFPKGAGPDFVNAAAVVNIGADYDPTSFLQVLHEIEKELGRRRTVRWGKRTLDLDLIAVEDAVVPDSATQTIWRLLPPDEQAIVAPDRLILPHPRMQDRAFVLVPLAGIVPEWRHPVLGLSVAQMLAALPQSDRDAIVPLERWLSRL